MKRPLAPVGGGLNEAVARTMQPVGTCSDSLNIRGIDPRTGRAVWAAQRAGMTDFGTPKPGAYVRHFATASKLVSARRLAELDIAEDTSLDPPKVDFAWETLLGDNVLDVAEGLDGQGYFLVESGDVVVVSKGGEEVERILTSPERQFTAVPRVFVGEQGELYVAATRDEAIDGGAGRVYRWIRNLDGLWEEDWEAVIEEPISTFVYRGGLLYVAEDPPSRDGERAPAALTRIGSPLLGPQIAWRQTLVPRPIFDLSVTDRGQCLLSSPASDARGGSGGNGFSQRGIDWTPPEIISWDLKGWAWIDAFAANDMDGLIADGDAITVLRDRRFEVDEDSTQPDPQSPRRELRSLTQSVFVPPIWDQSAFNGLGGIKFRGFASMVSAPALEDSPDSTLAGSGSQAIIPTALDTWTMVMLIQLSEEQLLSTAVGRVLSQRTTIDTQADWLLRLDEKDDVSFLNLNGGNVTSGLGAADVDTRCVLLSIVSEGDGLPLRLHVNGDSTGITAPSNPDSNKQSGPYPIGTPGAFSTVVADGPYTTLGAGSPNRFSLLRATGVGTAIFRTAGTVGPFLARGDRLRDGVGSTRDLNLHAELTGVGIMTFTLPSEVRADSIAIWSAYGGGTPSSVAVAVERAGGGFVAVAEGALVRAPTETSENFQGVPRRTELFFDSTIALNPLDKVRLTFTPQANRYVVSEVELLFQETDSDNQASAEFTLAELVAWRGVVTDERQRMEGYIAHRWGVVDGLVAGHPHIGAPPGSPGDPPSGDDSAAVVASLLSPLPLLVKYSTDGSPLASFAGPGVGFGAAGSGEKVYAFGDPEPDGSSAADPGFGARLTKFEDLPRRLERKDLDFVPTTEKRPAYKPARLAIGPCDTVFVPYEPRSAAGDGARAIHRYDGQAMTLDWVYNTVRAPHAVSLGGFRFDATPQGFVDCGPEFLYVAVRGSNGARRLDVLGIRDTGEDARRDVERLAVLSNGDVMRKNTGDWGLVPNGAGALPGDLPFSATLFGNTIFADGTGYRAYNHATGTLRNFEESVKGDLPPRCQLVAAYRSRLLLARGDESFSIFQSAFGDPFDFDFGREVNSIAQAAAGTTASQGRIPEPITALIPFQDDYLFIGTTESLWVLSGDLSDGGRLDQVDKSQGVAFGYAWCESPSGIFYFSARGGVYLIRPGSRPISVSDGKIQRRLEDLDLQINNIRMEYNWIDRTVHVFVISKSLGRIAQHFTYEEPLRAWHIDSFGEDLGGLVTTARSLYGDSPDDRTLLLGFADGTARVWDQYAADDAGRPIESYVLNGPVVPGIAGAEVRISGIEADLASDQGPVEVAVRASNSADTPGPPSTFQELVPGRGLGVGVNFSAPALYVELRGTGAPWAAHIVRAELTNEGAARSIS